MYASEFLTLDFDIEPVLELDQDQCGLVCNSTCTHTTLGYNVECLASALTSLGRLDPTPTPSTDQIVHHSNSSHPSQGKPRNLNHYHKPLTRKVGRCAGRNPPSVHGGIQLYGLPGSQAGHLRPLFALSPRWVGRLTRSKGVLSPTQASSQCPWRSRLCPLPGVSPYASRRRGPARWMEFPQAMRPGSRPPAHRPRTPTQPPSIIFTHPLGDTQIRREIQKKGVSALPSVKPLLTGS